MNEAESYERFYSKNHLALNSENCTFKTLIL